MLRFLLSIFGAGEKREEDPELLVKDAIERAVDGTDPWLRAVSGYRKKLKPAVIRAIEHVTMLVDSLPSPVPMEIARHAVSPLTKTLFISKDEMRTVLGNDRTLKLFLQGDVDTSKKIIALLAMEKKERMIYGAELTGDVVTRDVPQVAVSFVAHRFMDATADEARTRRLLKRRAYDRLVSLALRRIVNMKTERRELEGRRKVLYYKQNLLKQGGWEFEENGPVEGLDIRGVEEELGQIESQLNLIGGNDRMLEVYLDVVADVLGRPEQNLWGRKECLILDSMGIKRSQVVDNAQELTLLELGNSEGHRLILMLVALCPEELMGIPR